METNTIKNHPVLTAENARKAATIECIDHPEWGTKQFTFDESEDGFHTHGSGCNSAILFACEFKFWRVATWKA